MGRGGDRGKGMGMAVVVGREWLRFQGLFHALFGGRRVRVRMAVGRFVLHVCILVACLGFLLFSEA